MLLLIDNYDSFTYNLVHYLGELGATCEVRRNDEITVAEAIGMKPQAIVLSPGPCTPNEAGICLDLITEAGPVIPLLGVCLGHQSIGQAYGGKVVRAPQPMHGKVSKVRHRNAGLFKDLPAEIGVTRYHSLIVERSSLPAALEVTAETSDGIIMGLQHTSHPVHGVQFHPESIASEHGHDLLARFPHDSRHRTAPSQLRQIGRLTPARGEIMPANTLKTIIGKVATGATLSVDEMQSALEIMMSGVATPAQMGAFLMALRVRGETVEEITGAAKLMREKMTRVEAPAGAVDIVGTGGDGHGTFNVSTCASLVAAGAGVKIAKHGNRSVSSISGASDVLAALGVKLDVPPATITREINEAGVGFMWAPMHHSALKHWAPIRGELAIRTVFNLLGPICNPAGVRRQVVGVFSWQWVEPIAHVLANLGCDHVWVVHGHDGLDELTTTGSTDVAEVKDGKVTVFEITPGDAGIPPAKLSDLRGGDAKTNATAILELLAGKKGPFRDIVLLNAAAALVVAGKATNLTDGVALAAHAIESGAAHAALDRLVAVSNTG